ncbi:hypothetical protein CV_0681 [Chromobacterium violaceum ATCC 12472]|uniref:Uncharacterized protein n=1 Tax=Chromobacterium violaceum (strain ATCC 12472 / DSM 30191 / JCM 1249 / CCUG 213 / NBRC 12614 / NCIMB 9131 / NCTC 9757 / MK) TaxID=243365 RepID=Q7P087_CHRVO|nr:hypothetical protein CV_0681 [Chromobacterium violaceum ATCC 12472]
MQLFFFYIKADDEIDGHISSPVELDYKNIVDCRSRRLPRRRKQNAKGMFRLSFFVPFPYLTWSRRPMKPPSS